MIKKIFALILFCLLGTAQVTHAKNTLQEAEVATALLRGIFSHLEYRIQRDGGEASKGVCFATSLIRLINDALQVSSGDFDPYIVGWMYWDVGEVIVRLATFNNSSSDQKIGDDIDAGSKPQAEEQASVSKMYTVVRGVLLPVIESGVALGLAFSKGNSIEEKGVRTICRALLSMTRLSTMLADAEIKSVKGVVLAMALLINAADVAYKIANEPDRCAREHRLVEERRQAQERERQRQEEENRKFWERWEKSWKEWDDQWDDQWEQEPENEARTASTNRERQQRNDDLRTLGLDPEADIVLDKDVIKGAYRTAAKRYHENGTEPNPEKMRDLNAANDRLKKKLSEDDN